MTLRKRTYDKAIDNINNDMENLTDDDYTDIDDNDIANNGDDVIDEGTHYRQHAAAPQPAAAQILNPARRLLAPPPRLFDAPAARQTDAPRLLF